MTDNSRSKEDLEVFMTSCPELFKQGKIKIFQSFFCPISIVEADVKEYVIDEYESVEFLILRLYEAGLHDPLSITNLTGIDVNMVKKLLFAETYTYNHINPDTGELTFAGQNTLKDNLDIDNLFQYALYDVKRELQVDSLTGSLIRADAEIPKGKMIYYNDAIKPNVLPKESVIIDKTLEAEIQTRLQLYINEGYFSDGNTINSIGEMHTREIKYRRAYYATFENFYYPMIVISYFKVTDGTTKKVLCPIAIAESDFMKLGMDRTKCAYLIRSDENFEYILKYQAEFEQCPEVDEYEIKRLLEIEYNDNNIQHFFDETIDDAIAAEPEEYK